MKIFRLFRLNAVACFLGVAFCATLFAADLKPVVSITLSGYENLDRSFEKVLDIAGYKEFHTVLTMMTNGVDGIDKSKPAGFVLLGDNNDLVPAAFFPIADFEAFTCPGIEVLKEMINYNADEKTVRFDGNPTDEKEDSSGEIFRLIERNGWLFVLPVKNESSLPEQIDPAEWMGGIDAKYLAGGIIHVDRVPAELIDSLLAGHRVSASQDENVAKTLEAMGKLSDFIKANIQTIEFGVSVDQSTGDILLSSVTTPVSDSSFARTVEKNQSPATLWSDFYHTDNSVFAFVQSHLLEPEMAEFRKNQWDSSLNNVITAISAEEEEEEKNITEVKDLLKEWQIWGDKNFDTNRSDNAFSFGVDGTFSAAVSIADGEGLQALIAKSFDLLKKELSASGESDDPDIDKFLKSIKVNDVKHNGYFVNAFEIPVSKIDKDFSFLIGIRDDSMMLIAGSAEETVSDTFKEKTSLSRSKNESPQKWVLSVPNLAKFAQTLDEVSQNEIADNIVSGLAEGGNEAVITGQSEVIVQGLHQWITIKGDLIKLVFDTVGSALSDEKDTDEGVLNPTTTSHSEQD